MKQSSKSVKKTSFGRDVLKLVSGTAFAQGLTILASPFLTRLYSPEAFGTLALFVSITSIIGVVACLRYELAIMLPESDEEAANLLGVSLCFVVLISILTVPIVWLGKPIILDLLKAPQLGAYLWLVPPMVFFSGLFLALNYWNSRTKHFSRLSVARVFQSVTTTGTQLGAGYASYGNSGSLIGASVLGFTMSSVVLGGQIWRDDSLLLRKSISWKNMKSGLERYYKFPLYNTWASLLNSTSWQLPSLMLSTFFSPTIVGYYALGHRLLSTPMNLIGNSIRQVFLGRAAEAKNQGKISDLIEIVFEKLVSYGIFPMLLLGFIGKNIFITIFGETWSTAGAYVQILSIYMFFNFIASPLTQLFSVLEKQEVALITNLILFISRLLALMIGGYTGSEIFTLILFSLSGILVYGGYSLWIIRAAGVSVKFWLFTILNYGIISIILISFSWLICLILNLKSWMLLATYTTSAIIYYLYLIKIRNTYKFKL